MEHSAEETNNLNYIFAIRTEINLSYFERKTTGCSIKESRCFPANF
jgi:hypothetical protein